MKVDIKIEYCDKCDKKVEVEEKYGNVIEYDGKKPLREYIVRCKLGHKFIIFFHIFHRFPTDSIATKKNPDHVKTIFLDDVSSLSEP